MGFEGQFISDLRAGYVYIMTCPHMPDTIRIGAAVSDVGKVVFEPFGSSAPTDCDVEFSIHVSDRHELERVLQQKFARFRVPGEENLYTVSTDEAVAAIVDYVDYDYTNAAITGVLFRKQVQALRKADADLKNRRKSLATLTVELTEMQDRLRDCQAEIAARDETIAKLDRRIGRMALTRRLSFVIGAAGLAAAFAVVAMSWPPAV